MELPAREPGVGFVLIKDETSRTGFPFAAVLGASRACFRAIAERLNIPLDSDIGATKLAAHTRYLTLVNASEGNFSCAVAYTWRILGIPVRADLPSTATQVTIENLRSERAEVILCPKAVAQAAITAHSSAVHRKEDILIDGLTSLSGSSRQAQWIVYGYETMLCELDLPVKTFFT
ncbi:hypothetical protein B0T10DRAFT_567891 [Thelonectria olida]|uniref:Tryptophan synthase beta chain-like PALP domain-containing protein n=1 Tax=Thelonectria olida TaxID=1576542 RepID=A0A9P9AIY7_9HYPO|nr:hypothetical protein B0T10DRAFT_567891 [Thelonectria olida]